jgi:hypothetical protein
LGVSDESRYITGLTMPIDAGDAEELVEFGQLGDST